MCPPLRRCSDLVLPHPDLQTRLRPSPPLFSPVCTLTDFCHTSKERNIQLLWNDCTTINTPGQGYPFFLLVTAVTANTVALEHVSSEFPASFLRSHFSSLSPTFSYFPMWRLLCGFVTQRFDAPLNPFSRHSPTFLAARCPRGSPTRFSPRIAPPRVLHCPFRDFPLHFFTKSFFFFSFPQRQIY